MSCRSATPPATALSAAAVADVSAQLGKPARLDVEEVGSTDVAWQIWSTEFGAPAAIFVTS